LSWCFTVWFTGIAACTAPDLAAEESFMLEVRVSLFNILTLEWCEESN
jgi:hypothetical protein